MLGVNSEQKESMQHYISDSIYGLTLTWITSENSTKQLECRHLLTQPSLLDPISSHWSHHSGVRCRLPLSVVPRQLLSAPFSNKLSSRVPLPLPDMPRFQVRKPFVWFRAKTDKGIICLAGHPFSVTEDLNFMTMKNILHFFVVNIYLYTHILYICKQILIEPNWLGQLTKLTASLLRSKPSPSDMILNPLVVRLQCWRFGECGIILHWHYSLVHSDPEF